MKNFPRLFGFSNQLKNSIGVTKNGKQCPKSDRILNYKQQKQRIESRQSPSRMIGKAWLIFFRTKYALFTYGFSGTKNFNFLDFRELTKDMLKTTKKAITKKGHRVVNAIIDQELKLTPQKTTNIVRTIDI